MAAAKRGPRTGYGQNVGRFTGRPVRLTKKGEELLANRELDGQIISSTYACKESDTGKEVLVHLNEGVDFPENDAEIIAARHFGTIARKVTAHKIAHVKYVLMDMGLPTERLAQKYLYTDDKYEPVLHVDNGAVRCECCQNKASVPEAWKKKK